MNARFPAFGRVSDCFRCRLLLPVVIALSCASLAMATSGEEPLAITTSDLVSFVASSSTDPALKLYVLSHSSAGDWHVQSALAAPDTVEIGSVSGGCYRTSAGMTRDVQS